MALIYKSFVLSFSVLGRMIWPLLGVFVVATVIWGILSMLSLGYSDVISGPITATFIALMGMRAAFSVLGDNSKTSYDILALYAVLYGLVLMIAKAGAVLVSNFSAVIFADWQLGTAVSVQNLVNAERALQSGFALYAISANIVFTFVLYTLVHVAMAVPLASAACRAGHRSKHTGFFHGFGRKFIPLFCVFTLTFFLQFFFNLISAFFALLMLFGSFVAMIFFQTVPDFDPEFIITGVLAGLGLIWLHAWGWTASAMALIDSDQAMSEKQTKVQAFNPTPELDLRALRKSRE